MKKRLHLSIALCFCIGVLFSQNLPSEVRLTDDGRLIHGGNPTEGFDDPNVVHKLEITLEESIDRSSPWGINSNEAKLMHNAIGEMIAVDCRPYSIVEEIGFQRFMKRLEPNYKVQSQNYYSKKIVPSIFKKVLMKMQEVIDEASNISHTTNIWTNSSNQSFFYLAAHCVDKEFRKVSADFACGTHS